MSTEIPRSAEFYVRTGLNRALEKVQDDIDKIKKAIEHPEIVLSIKGSLENILSQHRQWYKEAVAEYRELPENIRPVKDLLDWKDGS
jgi:prefoldin subunit 5